MELWREGAESLERTSYQRNLCHRVLSIPLILKTDLVHGARHRRGLRMPEVQDVPRADGDVGVAQRQGQRPQQRLVRHRPPRLELRAQLTQVLYLLPLLPAEIERRTKINGYPRARPKSLGQARRP